MLESNPLKSRFSVRELTVLSHTSCAAGQGDAPAPQEAVQPDLLPSSPRRDTLTWLWCWCVHNPQRRDQYRALQIHGTRQKVLRFAWSYLSYVWSTVRLCPAEYADIFRSHGKKKLCLRLYVRDSLYDIVWFEAEKHDRALPRERSPRSNLRRASREGRQKKTNRGERLCTGNRHLRNHRGFSVAFSSGFSVAFSNGISLFSGIFQRFVPCPVDCYWNYPMIVQWHFPMDLFLFDCWCVTFCPGQNTRRTQQVRRFLGRGT